MPLSTDLEADFRHGGWKADRQRVANALAALGLSYARRQRFSECGSGCVCEINRTTEEFRLRANYCGDRFCRPCARGRSAKLRRRLIEHMPHGRHSCLTLTLAGGPDDTCRGQMDRLFDSWSRLRRREIMENVVGGASMLEITRGKAGDHWHVHSHVLMRCPWVDIRALSRAWMEITGDSWNVSIRACDTREHAAYYAAKYAGKGFDGTVLKEPKVLSECITALSGRRTFATFGSWHDMPTATEVQAVGEWEFLYSLETVVERAKAGEEWARGLLCMQTA
jgi:hypothetical protein